MKPIFRKLSMPRLRKFTETASDYVI
jgi:hypothetical protein